MLEVVNLKCGYPSVEIIKEISFNVRKGEKLCIIGPNGCGKTTLLRALSSLIDYKGNILLEGKEVNKIPRKECAKKIALMTQTTNVYFPYTVFEIVSFGRYSRIEGSFNRLSKIDVEIILNAIEEVGLINEKNKLVSELSGGQFQRAFLAKAFAQDPDILLLDEPTNHLDIKCQYDFLDQLEKWTTSGEKTVISVMHDINLAAVFSNKALMLKNGVISFNGDLKEVMHSNKLKEVYEIDIKNIMINALEKWK